ncbi:MAG TPA: AAA family ATPase, partial [Solirubrobacterales bacterium]
MGIFKKQDALDEAAESGRMRPEDLVGPTPDRQEEATPEMDEPKVEPAEDKPKEEAKGNPEKPKNEGPAKVIAFANQKGGVAKTTTALNLAVAFKESGHRVLAVDMDPQGNLTMSQGIDPDKVERSMFDVLVHRIPI